jgi:hypothetical protein
MSDFDYSQFEEEPEPQKPNNRTFAIIASILGAIILLSLVAIAAYFIFLNPGKTANQADIAAKISAENTATVMAVTEDAMAVVLPLDTPVPAEVVLPAELPTELPAGEVDQPVVDDSTGGQLTEDLAMTATVEALLTQAAGGAVVEAAGSVIVDAAAPAAVETATPQRAATLAPTPAALPTTGFADEMGLPGLVGLAFLFIVVITIARQVRAAQYR